MRAINPVALVTLLLILAKTLAEIWLDRLNARHVRAHAGDIPEDFKTMIDAPAYRKSIEYTLAKARVSQLESVLDAALLLVVLFSGVLPWTYRLFTTSPNPPAWIGAAFLMAISLGLSLPGLPLSWYRQFQLEERFGFNTTTQKTWWLDRIKSVLLGIVLGFPLLWLVLKIVDWTGPWWWLWAWGALMLFQVLMSVLAPVLILPLFNKFTPLPEGTLRERLLRLAGRTRFRARSIQLMDGSKRSLHSNAFFTGFGRFRKIVLFDTLVQQLEEPELEAVLAHEIGHFKKRHIPKNLALAALGSLGGLFLLSVLAKQEWLYHAFGFGSGPISIALLLFGLLSGVVTFWSGPLVHWWSRRYEYQADAFAANTLNTAEPLIQALRKLNRKNLSNLTPHPVYSAFYYSHPALLERELALRRAGQVVGETLSRCDKQGASRA